MRSIVFEFIAFSQTTEVVQNFIDIFIKRTKTSTRSQIHCDQPMRRSGCVANSTSQFGRIVNRANNTTLWTILNKSLHIRRRAPFTAFTGCRGRGRLCTNHYEWEMFSNVYIRGEDYCVYLLSSLVDVALSFPVFRLQTSCMSS